MYYTETRKNVVNIPKATWCVHKLRCFLQQMCHVNEFDDPIKTHDDNNQPPSGDKTMQSTN